MTQAEQWCRDDKDTHHIIYDDGHLGCLVEYGYFGGCVSLYGVRITFPDGSVGFYGDGDAWTAEGRYPYDSNGGYCVNSPGTTAFVKLAKPPRAWYYYDLFWEAEVLIPVQSSGTRLEIELGAPL